MSLSLNVEAFTDADWAGSKAARRFAKDYFTLVVVLYHKRVKQHHVTGSSSEAQHWAMTHGASNCCGSKHHLKNKDFRRWSYNSNMII